MSFGIFQFRRGSASDWSVANTVLLEGELGMETGTYKFKVGNGSTPWNSLPYGGVVGATGVTGPTGGIIGMSQSTIDFGSATQREYNTTVTVPDLNIQTTSKIVVSIAGDATADHSTDEILLERIYLTTTNIVANTSFDIIAYCESGTHGQYKVNYQIAY